MTPRADDVIAAAVLACALPLWVWAAHRLWLTIVALRERPTRSAPPAPGPDTPDASVTRPVVTVQLPLYNEPEVAERLLTAVGALRWPADRLEIQVLDDSTDETTARVATAAATLRARGLEVAHVRRERRGGFKAGALEHGLSLARGELLLVLDADFVPAPDLLERTVPCFADPRVAVVQARWGHLNRECDLLTEAQALMLDGHFRVEQAARHAGGRFFNFNGTAGLWRRAAITDAGGWSADTLTEDLDLSYRAQLRGWRFVYLPDVVAPAELPVTASAFKSQQFRWAKGSVQVARKLLPEVLGARVGWRVRLEALLHLTSNFAYPCTLALALACAALELPALRPHAGAATGLLGATTPVFVGATLAYAAYYLAAQQRERGILAAAARVPLVMAVGLGLAVNQTRAVLEGLAGEPGEFVRTPKSGAVGRRRGRVGGARAARWQRGIELGLAAAFAAALSLCLARGGSLAAPLYALAALGLAGIALRG
jgi:hypothetical protein